MRTEMPLLRMDGSSRAGTVVPRLRVAKCPVCHARLHSLSVFLDAGAFRAAEFVDQTCEEAEIHAQLLLMWPGAQGRGSSDAHCLRDPGGRARATPRRSWNS